MPRRRRTRWLGRVTARHLSENDDSQEQMKDTGAFSSKFVRPNQALHYVAGESVWTAIGATRDRNVPRPFRPTEFGGGCGRNAC